MVSGGDRRVLGGHIRRLSLSLHRVDADCSGSTKLKMNLAPPKTQHEIHNSPVTATATTSRRRATKHVPRVSPYSPASINPGFVEIGLVQLSKSVKATNDVTHTQYTADRQTDGQTIYGANPGLFFVYSCLIFESRFVIFVVFQQKLHYP